MSSDPQEKKRLRQACSSHLDQAERLKKFCLASSEEGKSNSISATTSSPLSLRVLKLPFSNRVLSTNEKIILLRGSKLHGLVFPEWTTDPICDEFKLGDGNEKFL